MTAERSHPGEPERRVQKGEPSSLVLFSKEEERRSAAAEKVAIGDKR
jgi:hypothetical protein